MFGLKGWQIAGLGVAAAGAVFAGSAAAKGLLVGGRSWSLGLRCRSIPTVSASIARFALPG